MSNILEIKGLSAGYGPLRVIHDLDLIIQCFNFSNICGCISTIVWELTPWACI